MALIKVPSKTEVKTEIKLLDREPPMILNSHKRKSLTPHDNILSFVKVKNETTVRLIMESFNQNKKEHPQSNSYDQWYLLISKYSSYISPH